MQVWVVVCALGSRDRGSAWGRVAQHAHIGPSRWPRHRVLYTHPPPHSFHTTLPFSALCRRRPRPCTQAYCDFSAASPVGGAMVFGCGFGSRTVGRCHHNLKPSSQAFGVQLEVTSCVCTRRSTQTTARNKIAGRSNTRRFSHQNILNRSKRKRAEFSSECCSV